MPRVATIKTLKKTADKLWALVVKVRAENRCEYCGKKDHLNSHHIYSRSNLAVRWELNNGVCLCSGHHALCTFSAHKAPMEFMQWLTQKRGDEWAADLSAMSHIVKRFKEADLREIIENLNRELKDET